eukprot:TRINITY_DN16322_c0_g1_i1.p1 TRINITY_DN16322_c0_g1~~TRINITY_DN16322_c0_g1_i1.p1  ORF type:complete len:602 (+),score=188.62 TRINITY_DN16322_c0_g1_i1:73-1806(+)
MLPAAGAGGPRGSLSDSWSPESPLDLARAVRRDRELRPPRVAIAFEIVDARKEAAPDGGSSFWAYHVVARTTLAGWQDPRPAPAHFRRGEDGAVEVICVRRFREFEWLHGALQAESPGAIVPPIPSKDAAAGTVDKVFDYFGAGDEPGDDPSSRPLIAHRMHMLELCLQYMGGSPLLSSSPILLGWCTRNGPELAEWKASVHADQAAARAAVPAPSAGVSGWLRSWLPAAPGGPGGGAGAAALGRAGGRRRALAESLGAAVRELRRSWTALQERERADRAAVARLPSDWAAGAAAEAGPQALCARDAEPGLRVADADGHCGVIRWKGLLPKGPRPELTYIGVEWDDPGVGKCDGTIFGDRHFDAAPQSASFLLPEVLFPKGATPAAPHPAPAGGGSPSALGVPFPGDDALLAALAHVGRQVEQAVSAERDSRRRRLERGEHLLTFWARVMDSAVRAADSISALRSQAAAFEQQGAANGRSQELAVLGELISEAERRFDAEWAYCRAQWALQWREVAQCFVEQGLDCELAAHPFAAALTQRVESLPEGGVPTQPLLQPSSSRDRSPQHHDPAAAVRTL